MVTLKSFIEQIIYISIVLIIIEIIMPKGNTKKYVYVILSLFLLLNILSPVVNILKDVDIRNALDNVIQTVSGNVQTESTVNVAEFTEYKNTKLKKELESRLTSDIKIKLLELDIEVKEVNVKVDKDNNFKGLEIVIANLEHLGDNKISKISEAIKIVSVSYLVDEKNVIISEEGK